MKQMTKLGRAGEERAAVYLDSKGFEILERNFRCRFGEIDIIAMDGDTLCFIEVKTRRNRHFGLPAEAVSGQKMLRIQRCAYTFLQRFRGEYKEIRVDIVEIMLIGNTFYIRHLPGGRSA